MARFVVLLTDYAWPDLEIERRILHEVGADLRVAPAADVNTLRSLAGEADGILTCWAPTPAEVIAAAPKLRVISRFGVGLDNIDVAAATGRGIVVTNVPDYCRVEVAEHTIALLLSLARKIVLYHRETKDGRYDRNAGGPLRRIEGQTLGIVGLGSIGSLVAQKALALGLRVLAASRREKLDIEGVQRRELDPLLAESDYVSLHIPLNDKTRGLFGAERLARMKPGSYLINTARGALVDRAALTAALDSGHLFGAALDVQDPEPPDLAAPPYSHPNVIVTPHAAFLSEESLLELRTRATEQLAERLLGRTPANVVNPEALSISGV